MFRVEYWVISTLFCCGLIAGLLLSWPGSSTPHPPNPLPDREPLDSASSHRLLRSLAIDLGVDEQLSLEETAARVVRQADQNLLLGNYAGAVKLLQSLLKQHEAQKDAGLLVRLALAEERRGSLQSAEKIYLQAIKQPATQVVELAGLTGLARVWLELDKSDLALELLSDLALHSEGYREASPYLSGDILALLAFAAREQALKTIEPHPYELSGVNFGEPQVDLELLIDLLQSASSVTGPSGPADPAAPASPAGFPQESATHTEPGGSATPPIESVAGHQESTSSSNPAALLESDTTRITAPTGVAILQAESNSADQIILACHCEVTALPILLEQLATHTGLGLEFAAGASERLSGRSKAIHASQLTLANVLDALLAPIDLQWSQNGDQIQIYPPGDHPERYWLESAFRNWSHFLNVTGKDRRTIFAYFEQGSLQLLKGDINLAATHFQLALQHGAKQDLAAQVHLNQARIDAGLGRHEEAIATLFRAVDVAENKHLTAQAYYFIGAIAANLGQMEVATNTSSRAISLSQDDPLTVQAVLVLMRAYLLQNKPFAANQALYQQRERFTSEIDILRASFLGSYARYLGTELEEARRNESYRLLASLTALESTPGNTIDRYLAARAYQSLGFDGHAVTQLQQALGTSLVDYWQSRVLYELALQMRAQNNRDEAARYLELLTHSSSPELAASARIQLVELQLDNRDFVAVITSARELLQSKLNSEQQRALLTMLGLAYRQTGEPYAAALCFAGMLPVEGPQQ